METEFKIGDEVIYKNDAIRVAKGSAAHALRDYKGTIIGIHCTETAVEYDSNGGCSGHCRDKENNFIPYSEAKDFIIAYLAERITAVAAMEM